MRLLSSLGFAAFLAVSWSGAARADVVGPPPDICPSGATPNSCHGGPFCAPKLCTTSADCTGGAVCTEQPFCVTQISCAGFIPPDADPSEFNQPNAGGLCPDGNECKPPAVCQKINVCLLPWESGTSSSGAGGGGTTSGGATGESGGCSCRVPGVAEVPGELGGAAALGALALAAGIALARRRKG